MFLDLTYFHNFYSSLHYLCTTPQATSFQFYRVEIKFIIIIIIIILISGFYQKGSAASSLKIWPVIPGHRKCFVYISP